MKVFTCEDCAVGFFSAVFKAYESKIMPDIITSSKTYQPSFTTEVIGVINNEVNAKRVENAIIKYTGFTSEVKNIRLALLSSSSLKETICYNYIKLIVEKKQRVDKMLNEIAVIEFNELKDKITYEKHRMTGFLRFHETDKGVLYAHYEPDNNITEILAPHFAKRLNNIPFIIHDVKRNVLALYNGKEIRTIKSDTPLYIYFSEQEESMQKLWKKYFDSVNIKERPHLKQQDGYLPRRYRKHMSEFSL